MHAVNANAKIISKKIIRKSLVLSTVWAMLVVPSALFGAPSAPQVKTASGTITASFRGRRIQPIPSFLLNKPLKSRGWGSTLPAREGEAKQWHQHT